MQLLIFLDPEFWWGVVVAMWAQFGDVILELTLLVLLVSVMLWLIYQSIMARKSL